MASPHPTHPTTTLVAGFPRRRCARFLLAPLTLVALAATATGQDSTQDISSEIGEILSWVTPSSPGCAVAVASNGELIVHSAYGSADLANEVPLTTDTVFDIGSVVKQFVAATVLLLVDDERCSLSDDIRKYVPELHDYGHVITIDHLLTHTSGLRDWTGLRRLSTEDEDALTMILRQRGLDFPPGEEWSYSNSGYVLLKELVARLTEMTFAEFAHRRIFEPLGMKATTYAIDPGEGQEKLAIAYEKQGVEWREDVLVGNERGGGGALLSTVGDLITWNAALRDARLGELVTEKLGEPARLNNGRELGYTRGLFLEDSPGRRLYWHTGSAGAFKALLNRFPDQGLSIAILSNAGENANRMELARRITDLLLPASDSPDAAPSAAAQEVDVTSRAGMFFSERSGDPLHLVAQRGELRIVGGPPLVPVAEDRFRNAQPMLSFMSQDDFEVQFLSNDQLELESMEGEITRYRRAEPAAPTAEELRAFAGSFQSDELLAVLEVEAEGDHLSMRLNDSPPFRFATVDRDAFQFRRFFVRFRRDEGGKVEALEFSNPVLRRVRFTRMND